MIEIFKDIEGYEGLYKISDKGVVYPSLSEIQRQLGFAQGHISNVCNGKYKQAYGFHWKYVI